MNYEETKWFSELIIEHFEYNDNLSIDYFNYLLKESQAKPNEVNN